MRDVCRHGYVALHQAEPGGASDGLLIGALGLASALRGALNRSEDLCAQLLARACVSEALSLRDCGQ